MTENYQNPTQKIRNMPQGNDEKGKRSSPVTNDQGDKPQPKDMAMKPGFYLVATPIGNLRDITFRALDVLSSVDLIICEDTRVTGKLMNAYGFKKRMQIYNDHSTDNQRDTLISLVESGHSVAVLSDAGTPLISDPGYKLVRGAIEKNLLVTSIPGPNAALTALQLSALPTDQFSFLGFLPPKTTHYTEKGAPKGEIVVAIGRAAEVVVSSESIEKQLQNALEKMSVRDAAEMVAQATGKPKKTIYTLALKLSSSSNK